MFQWIYLISLSIFLISWLQNEENGGEALYLYKNISLQMQAL